MKTNIKEKLGDIFELPQDATRDIPKITLYGNELLLIENHQGIRVYDEDSLTVGTTLGFLKVKGNNLLISRFDETYIVVQGNINTVKMGAEEEDG